jgi:hypothetical protein
VKLVLVMPPCGFCWDRDAQYEVMTRWGCWASLCAECTAKYDSGREEPRSLKAGAAVGPRLTADQAGAYVDAQEWVFAKTMPKWPHEYVLIWRSRTRGCTCGWSRSSAVWGSGAGGAATSPTTGRGGSRVLGDAAPGNDLEPVPPGLAGLGAHSAAGAMAFSAAPRLGCTTFRATQLLNGPPKCSM